MPASRYTYDSKPDRRWTPAHQSHQKAPEDRYSNRDFGARKKTKDTEFRKRSIRKFTPYPSSGQRNSVHQSYQKPLNGDPLLPPRPKWIPVETYIPTPEPSPVDRSSSTEPSSSLSTKVSSSSSSFSSSTGNISVPTSIQRPHESNTNFKMNTDSTPLNPSIEEIRKPVPNTPLLTQVILGIISSIQTLSKRITPLEAAKEREDINIKAHNWCFEAAEQKCHGLRDLREMFDLGEMYSDDPEGNGDSLGKILEQLMECQMTLLDAVRKEMDTRESELENLRREVWDLKAAMNNNDNWRI